MYKIEKETLHFQFYIFCSFSIDWHWTFRSSSIFQILIWIIKVDEILFTSFIILYIKMKIIFIKSRKCLLVKLDKNSLSDISKTSLDSSENLWQCKIGCRKLPPHRLYQIKSHESWKYMHIYAYYMQYEIKETRSWYDNFNINFLFNQLFDIYLI